MNNFNGPPVKAEIDPKEADITLARKYELTNALLDFESKDGLTLADFGILIKNTLINRITQKNTNLHRKTYSDNLNEVLKQVTLKGQPIGDSDKLLKFFLNTQKELFAYLSKKNLSLTPEDVILLRGLFEKKLMKTNMLPVAGTVGEVLVAHSPSVYCTLRVIVTMMYLPYDQELVKFFAKNSEAQTSDFIDFMKGKPELRKKVIAKLEMCLERDKMNEFCEEHIVLWDKITDTSGFSSLAEHDESKAYLDMARKLGIPDQITNFYDNPFRTLMEQNNVLKNNYYGFLNLVDKLKYLDRVEAEGK